MRLPGLWVLSGMLLSAGSSVSLAQDQGAVATVPGNVTVYELADALLADGEADLACAFVDGAYGPDTEDLGALSRLGNCLMGQERLEESLIVLERAVLLHPDETVLAEQLTLARVALALREAMNEPEQRVAQVSQARPVAAPAPAMPPEPPPVPELPGPIFSGQARLERIYSNNVNGGTYADSFIGFGLPLTVGVDSKEKAGASTRIAVDGGLLVPLDWENAIKLDAGIVANIQDVHGNLSRFDLDLAGAWITGTNLLGGQIRPHADLAWIGGLYEGVTVGLEGSGHAMVSDRTTLTGKVDVAHRFRDQAADEGWVISGKIGVRHAVTAELQVGANLLAERVALGSAARSYWLGGAEVYLDAALTEALTLNVNAGVDLVGFDGMIAMFASPRNDARWRAGANLVWSLAHITPGLSMQASYNYSAQQSDQDLFVTRRHVGTVGLRYAF
jgi:hypothetical protein